MESTMQQKSRNQTESRATSLKDCEMHPAQDFLCYVKDYARQKPDVAALWCFGIGFVLGWKVKPW